MTFDELKKKIKTRVSSLITQNVYNNIGEGSYPYCIITYPSTSKEFRWQENKMIEIDFWDNSGNSTTITNMSDLVKKGLDGYYYSSDDKTEGFRLYLDFEGEFLTGKPEIKRINQRYLCKVF